MAGCGHYWSVTSCRSCLCEKFSYSAITGGEEGEGESVTFIVPEKIGGYFHKHHNDRGASQTALPSIIPSWDIMINK